MGREGKRARTGNSKRRVGEALEISKHQQSAASGKLGRHQESDKDAI